MRFLVLIISLLLSGADVCATEMAASVGVDSCLGQADRPGDTIAALREAIDTGRALGGDYLRLGHAYLASGDRKRAARVFKRAIRRGFEAEGYTGLGMVQRHTEGRRVRSLYYFRRALSKDPEFVEAQYNLALTYQDLRSTEARSAFEKVVTLAPDHRDACYRIGRLLEEKGDRKGALAWYQRQIEAYPAHGEARYRLGKLLEGAGEKAKAARIFGRLMTSGGEVEGRSYMEMARLNQEARNYGNAQRLFEEYIGRLPEEEQRYFRDISPVSTPEELKIYRNTPEAQKEEMVRRFWNRRDPAPLTAANERLVEHYRRVAYAREHYAGGESPWDDRGEVYIRLGPPDHISRSNEVQVERELYLLHTRLNFARRFHPTRPVVPGLPIFPVEEDVRWEYWIYPEIDGGIEIAFVNKYTDGRYVFAPVPDWFPPSAAMRLLAFHGEMVLRKATADRPSIYTADFADLPIDFYYYPASYRGEEEQTRLEIYFGLPASEVARLKVDEVTDLLVLDRGLAIYDTLWNEVHRVQDRLTFTAPTEGQVLEGAFIPSVLPVDLPPGPYHFALQVRDLVSGKSQVYEQEMVLDDYRDREALQISDIELAFWVSPANEGGPFVKQGLKVIPMSSRAFRRNQHAFVYFEIYNLRRDAFGQTRYRVDYILRSYKQRGIPARILHGLGRALRVAEKDQEIVIAYDQTGQLQDEVTYVELDLTRAEAGGQRVRVQVTDLLTEQSTAKEITFKIAP